MATEVLSSTQHSVLHAHSAATTAKNFYVINGRVMMALHTKDADEDNVFVHEAPMARVPKVAAQAWATGTAVYWDATAENFTTVATANTLAGMVAEDALAADVEGIIYLTPFA